MSINKRIIQSNKRVFQRGFQWAEGYFKTYVHIILFISEIYSSNIDKPSVSIGYLREMCNSCQYYIIF